MKKREKKEKRAKKIKIPLSELPTSVIKKRKRRKRRIKLFITLTIFIAIGVTAFLMGWTRVKLEKDQIAIISNKIMKSKEIYKPDVFRWDWSKLIPGNIKIEIYDISQNRINIIKKGVLPSGDFYSKFISNGEEGYFSFSIDIELILQLKESQLFELISQNKIYPIESREHFSDSIKKKDIENENKDEKEEETEVSEKEEDINVEVSNINSSFYDDLEKTLKSELFNYINERSNDIDFVKKLGIDQSELKKELEQFITAQHPEIKLISLIPNEIIIPDFELYEKVKAITIEALKAPQTSELSKEIAKSTVFEKTNKNRLDALKELGEVLKEYPILMDYLKIYAKSDKDLDLLQLPN